MKLLLLHGPAITSSRGKLIDIKSKFDINSIVVFEKGSDIQTIIASISTLSLISDERLIILENPPEDFTNYQLLASRNEPITNYQLIIWFDHEITDKKPVLSWMRENKGETLYFPESKEISVFPFLDKLGAKEFGAYLEMDKLKKNGYDGQYLIIMIFYLLRNLVATPKKARDFVKKKMIRMRKNFTLEKLIDLYKFVLETDFKIKSGLLESNQAEFLLVYNFIV